MFEVAANMQPSYEGIQSLNGPAHPMLPIHRK